jgi:rod shape determining protein RodA
MNFSHLWRLGRNFDWLLMMAVLAIYGLGVAAIFSVTHHRSGITFWHQQLIWAGPMAVGFFSMLLIDYAWLKNLIKPLYVLNLGMLLFVMFAGHSALGAQRWIRIGSFSLQPSEFAKVLLIITMAYMLSVRPPQKFADLIPVGVHVGIPWLLIFKQPDLGTSLVLIAILFSLLWGAGLDGWILALLISPIASVVLHALNFPLWVLYLLGLGGIVAWRMRHRGQAIAAWVLNLVAGLSFPLAWGLLKEYQRNRLTIFLDPERDPLGAGYHITQSKIAIGSGGLWGKGWLHGTQTQLHFIPEQQTDFIFSAIGEELGFIGGCVLVLLFFVIFWRCLAIASQAKDDFGSLLAVGVTAMFAFHVFVNIGMTTGIMPVTGIPLPLVSYGGSTLLANALALGLIQGIAMRRQRLLF